ncbi:MAG: o-succinylbenzoate--CoA ligase [Calditrichaceae bacterium]|nr:o-succinylbenzoate--CoA ligase [Calditrichia bacterium]NUQ42433.1 o-succinylbenzoate--CoA ligase [Calditrichaceae bacterium]
MSSESFSFAEIAKKYLDYPAIIGPDYRISYRDYFHWISAIADGLRERHISPGERIAVLAPNCREYPALLMALWQIGAAAAPLSPRLPEGQIAALLEETDCSKLIRLRMASQSPTQNSEPAARRSPLDARFSILDLNIPDIRNPIPTKSRTSLFANRDEIFPDFKSDPTRGSGGMRHPNIPLDRNATLIFTSGSSGAPKAALHTFGNHYYNARGSNLNIPFGPGDRWLLSLPLYHVGGMAILFRALAGGGAVAIPDPGMPLIEAIPRLQATHLSLVATQLFRLLREDAPGKILANLKAILLGGGAIPASLVRQAAGLNLPIHTSYGCTEMASQVAATPPGAREKLSTSGRVLKYRELKIAPGGEIQVKGETLFRGYVRGTALEQRRDAQGWFPTGDLGALDEDGYLIVRGRKDNMFVSGGENIHPEEIEAQLCQMEGIEQALAVPLGDDEFGMRPAAFVKMQPGKTLDEQALRRFLESRIAKFKIPQRFFPWPDENAAQEGRQTGIKLNRQYFRELAEEKRRGGGGREA